MVLGIAFLRNYFLKLEIDISEMYGVISMVIL